MTSATMMVVDYQHQNGVLPDAMTESYWTFAVPSASETVWAMMGSIL